MTLKLTFLSLNLDDDFENNTSKINFMLFFVVFLLKIFLISP